VRRLIAHAAAVGILPAAVRAMIPRDWMLVAAGYAAARDAAAPGGRAPSRAAVADLLERCNHYG